MATTNIETYTPEHVALKLMYDFRRNEADEKEKKRILDLYAECLEAVQGKRDLSNKD